MPRSRLLPILGGLALVAVLTIGLVQTVSKSHKPKATHLTLAQQQAQLAGSPPELAALHRQASQLLGGGLPAVRARLAGLKGQPVVINKWGSWCGPCRIEFPVFQQASVKLGKQVAFLGLDGKDAVSDARTFLRENPLSYPSYKDPNENVARALQAGQYYPTTVFIDRQGRRTVHQGPYDDVRSLEQDVRRYALS